MKKKQTTRTIKNPPKKGTLKKSVIKKAVRTVIAERIAKSKKKKK